MQQKYRLLRRLGQGGTSEVFLAEDMTLHKLWAIKRIHRDQEVLTENFTKEAELMKQWNHPFLPRIVDVYEEEEAVCIVMDYIEGISLKELLEKQGRVEERQVILWAGQLVSVLDYLHSRKPAVIYRDMKPGNILLTKEGFVKLIDFGISREYEEAKEGDTSFLGTRGYAAPEQYGGRGQTDARTDIYGLGVVLYELLTGKSPLEPPFLSEMAQQWEPSVSRELAAIIEKCVSSDPGKRFQSCGELNIALEHLKDEKQVNERRKKKRRKVLKVLSGALALVAAVFFSSLKIKIQIRDRHYEELLWEAQLQTDEKEKTELLLQARRLCPERTEALSVIIEEAELDGIFTAKEQRAVEEVAGDPKDMREARDYGQVMQRVGQLYWYGTGEWHRGIIQSVPWFSEAFEALEGEEKVLAEKYHRTAKFWCEIEMAKAKGTESELLGDYLDSTREFLTDNLEETRTLQLELYALVLEAIVENEEELRSAGITEAETGFFLENAAYAIRTPSKEARGKILQKRIQELLENKLQAACEQ